MTLLIDNLKGLLNVPECKHLPERYFVVASLAAEHRPTSPLGWVACAQLRGKIRSSRREQNAALAESLRNGGRLRDLPQDPFLTEKGTYVARLNDPFRLHYEKGRNLGGGFLIGTQPGGVEQLVWHFGVSPESCLNYYKLEWNSDHVSPVRTPIIGSAGSAPFPPTGVVRVPPNVKTPEEAARWHALAGRADDKGADLAATITRMEKRLLASAGKVK